MSLWPCFRPGCGCSFSTCSERGGRGRFSARGLLARIVFGRAPRHTARTAPFPPAIHKTLALILATSAVMALGSRITHAGVTIDLALSGDTKDQREVLGATPTDLLGGGVASGDVNSDGIADWIIGVPGGDGPNN